MSGISLSEDIRDVIRLQNVPLPSELLQLSMKEIFNGKNFLLRYEPNESKKEIIAAILVSAFQMLDLAEKSIQIAIICAEKEIIADIYHLAKCFADKLGVDAQVFLGKVSAGAAESGNEIVKDVRIVIGSYGKIFHFASSNLIDVSKIKLVIRYDGVEDLEKEKNEMFFQEFVNLIPSSGVQFAFYFSKIPEMPANYAEKYIRAPTNMIICKNGFGVLNVPLQIDEKRHESREDVLKEIDLKDELKAFISKNRFLNISDLRMRELKAMKTILRGFSAAIKCHSEEMRNIMAVLSTLQNVDGSKNIPQAIVVSSCLIKMRSFIKMLESFCRGTPIKFCVCWKEIEGESEVSFEGINPQSSHILIGSAFRLGKYISDLNLDLTQVKSFSCLNFNEFGNDKKNQIYQITSSLPFGYQGIFYGEHFDEYSWRFIDRLKRKYWKFT
jgi:hypothetical protein